MEERRTIRTYGNYPARVFYKKSDVLDLETGVKVIGITVKEFDQIMFLGNYFKNIVGMTQLQIQEYLFNLSINIVFDATQDPDKPLKVTIKGENLYFHQIKLMASNAKIPTPFDKYLLKKPRGKETIYYNYGGKFYEYNGAELLTVEQAWETVRKMVSIDTHCMLVKTV